MRIFADENIPFSQAAFSQFGEVQRFNGRQVTQSDLTHADVLLVRSVTQVNAELLENTPVQFVASATIGFDHIDLDYLASKNIPFARAPGSNAISAAEYVVSGLLILARQQGFNLKDKTVGIIGCGNVGSRVQKRLQALGVRCLPHDPPLAEKTGDTQFVDRETLLSADIVTMHVPLVKTGAHPTLALADQPFFEQFSDSGIFINTSRGDVVVEAALKEKIQTCPDFHTILDVWEGEPAIDAELLKQTNLGSPHIAGYSLDGKIRGTEMIYTALCAHLNVEPTWSAAEVLPEPMVKDISFSAEIDDWQALYLAVMTCYDVRDDDALLRQSNPAEQFDLLRKHYRARREFANLRVHVPAEKTALAQMLSGLDFQVEVMQ